MCRALPTTRVIAVHMEALNHCFLTRDELRGRLHQKGMLERVDMPEDDASSELPG